MKKIIVGNDQAIWRKALGKELKKSENKKLPLKHAKKMVWFDKESKIPIVILDECVFSPELQY